MAEKRLTERQRRFVESYLASGNAMEAAKLAGYRCPHPEGSRLLRNATVALAIAAASTQRAGVALADRQERMEFLTRMMRDSQEDAGNRLRASDILNRMDGSYVERREITGIGGVAIEPVIHVYVPARPEPEAPALGAISPLLKSEPAPAKKAEIRDLAHPVAPPEAPAEQDSEPSKISRNTGEDERPEDPAPQVSGRPPLTYAEAFYARTVAMEDELRRRGI